MNTEIKKSIYEHIALTTGYYLTTERLDVVCDDVQKRIDAGEWYFGILYELEKASFPECRDKTKGAFYDGTDRMEWQKRNQAKKVKQFSLDGIYIATYDSLLDAALAIGNKNRKSEISRTANGKLSNAYGFKWEWESEGN